MKQEGMVTKEMLRKVQSIIDDRSQLESWVERLEQTEPALYEWTHKMIGNIISELSGRVRGLTVQNAQGIAHGFVIAFTAGWIILTQIGDEEMDKLMSSNPEEEFEAWMRGELPDEYYDYTLNSCEKDSTQWKAKRAHLDRKKKMKEMSDFNEIKKKIKPNITVKKKDTESFLSKFNGTKKKDE